MSKVLIVDDDPGTRLYVRDGLNYAGHIVDEAPNGELALLKIQSMHPDVVLLDVMMPGMNGYEVLRAVRGNPLLSQTEIYVITSSDDEAALMESLLAGADHFIQKPVNMRELRQRVNNFSRFHKRAQLLDKVDCAGLSVAAAQDIWESVVLGWSLAMGLRDKETEAHNLRVANMAVYLARLMGMPEDEVVYVRWGGILHDIGKIGVPDTILFKPGPLTPEERQIMERHPAHALELLKGLDFLRPALEIPYSHHERWNGTGYPQGLAGAQIPLAARIFAVIDVWDALNSNRPYRPAWTPEAVKAHIRQQSGVQFDPTVVAAFLDNME